VEKQRTLVPGAGAIMSRRADTWSMAVERTKR
jgi:hypothetical protein